MDETDRLRERVRRHRQVHDAVDEVSACLSESEVHEIAVESVSSLLSSPCSLYLDDGDGLALAAATGFDGNPPSRADGDLGDALETGARRALPGDEADLPFPARERVVVVPVGKRGVLATTGAAFDDEDLDLAERVLAQVDTKLHRFEVSEELDESNRRLLSLMSNVPGTVYQCANTPDREMTFVTHDCAELTGYDRAEFLNGEVSWREDLVHPSDRGRVDDLVQGKVADLELYQLQYRIVTKSGQEKWVWDNGGGVFEDGTASQLEGFIIDVTERQQHKQRLEVLNRVLRHNLRNNMNVIMGYAETLENELSQSDPMLHANYIKEEARELTQLGEKARKIEQALQSDQDSSVRIDVAEMVARKAAEYRKRFPAATVRVEAPESVPLEVPHSIDYALENIIENGIVHNDQSEPTVEVFVFETDGEHNEWIEIVVADDGPGIPDHEVQALLEGSETPLRHGSGLGLWLVNWIVKRSGGELQFDENDPRGSVVTMRFPA